MKDDVLIDRRWKSEVLQWIGASRSLFCGNESHSKPSAVHGGYKTSVDVIQNSNIVHRTASAKAARHRWAWNRRPNALQQWLYRLALWWPSPIPTYFKRLVLSPHSGSLTIFSFKRRRRLLWSFANVVSPWLLFRTTNTATATMAVSFS